MKKIAGWTLAISLTVLIIAMGVMGVKIFTNDYDITVEAYVTLFSYTLLLASIVCLRYGRSKCPHCGRLRMTGGEYCAHCGRKI